jgi:3-oxoacyl-(acyl-carrier-protein) synthase
MNLALKRVVVTGLGAVTPLGKGIPEYWDGLVNGVSGAGFIRQFDVSKFKTKFACEVKDFNPEAYFEQRHASSTGSLNSPLWRPMRLYGQQDSRKKVSTTTEWVLSGVQVSGV